MTGRKKIIPQRPYAPEVTREQLLAYNSARPETYTKFAIVNSVLNVLTAKGGLINPYVAQHLGLDSKKLAYTFETLTGTTIAELRLELLARRWREYVEENPYFTQVELAKALGFKDPGAMHHFHERHRKDFPDLPLKETPMQRSVDRAVNSFFEEESETIRRLYCNLPYKGTKEERQECITLIYNHAVNVANLSLRILERHPELPAIPEYLREYAMLHNVGVVFTDAPQLYCHGSAPYSQHPQLGADYLRTHHRVPLCDIVAQNHSLVHSQLAGGSTTAAPYDEIVAYAAALFPMAWPPRSLTPQQARERLAAKSPAAAARFDELHRKLG